jgi:hypothetical protein
VNGNEEGIRLLLGACGDGIDVIGYDPGGAGRENEDHLWRVTLRRQRNGLSELVLPAHYNVVLIEIGHNNARAFYQPDASVPLPDAVFVRAHANVTEASLRGMYDKSGIFQRQDSGDAVYLLALKRLTETPVRFFEAFFPEIPRDAPAASSKICKRIGASFSDTVIGNRHTLSLLRVLLTYLICNISIILN